MRFYKKIYLPFVLLLFFLLFPMCEAKALDPAVTHDFLGKAARLGLSPADALSGNQLSALLDTPLSAKDSPLTLDEFCVLLCSYREEKELLLPARITTEPDIPRGTISHWHQVIDIYESGILGDRLSYEDVHQTVSAARGCLLLSAFLSATVPPDPFQPVSSLKVESETAPDSLAHTLFLGHSNALALGRYTSSPMTFAASNGVNVSAFLSMRLTQIPSNEKDYAENILREQPYEKVYIMLGTNDLVHGIEGLDDFSRCLREIIALVQHCQPGAGLCLVGVTPLMFSEPFRIQFRQDMIRAYNQSLKSLSRELGLAYLDMFTPLAAPDGYNRPELSKEDGIHYKNEGYALILNEICSHPLP